MFSSLKAKIILGVYVFLMLSIPVGAYLVSQNQTTKSSASEKKDRNINLKGGSSLSPADELKTLSSTPSSSTKTETPSSPPSLAQASSFGPTLNFKLTLEGRPERKMGSKVFVGIAEGPSQDKPKYILSFSVDLPDSGLFEGLSLAGLTSGSQYTAYLKPSVQIATSSAFVMSPSITNLNNGQALKVLTGDLNQDNTINASDYSIAKASFGATPGTPLWNENIDFNKDGLINTVDLGFITRNYGKTGASGVWVSSPPAVATKSASTTSPSQGGPASPSGGPPETYTFGHWLWVP